MTHHDAHSQRGTNARAHRIYMANASCASGASCPDGDAKHSQEAGDQAGDVVLGIVRKNSREAFEVRLRTIAGTRMVLLRLCRQDAHGSWRPLSTSARCGVTIRADLLTETLDLLEAAEDRLGDEGAIS